MQADKGRATVILEHQNYVITCMVHTNLEPYQLLDKGTGMKIKTKILKQLESLQNREIIDIKLYHYLKPTDSPAPRFRG